MLSHAKYYAAACEESYQYYQSFNDIVFVVFLNSVCLKEGISFNTFMVCRNGLFSSQMTNSTTAIHFFKPLAISFSDLRNLIVINKEEIIAKVDHGCGKMLVYSLNIY